MSILTTVRNEARSYIDRYEQANDPREVRPYHSWWHTDDVHDRVVRLIKAIRINAPELVTDEDADATQAAAYAHDVVQTCIYIKGQNGTMRKRFSGPIEGASAMWLLTVVGDSFTAVQKETAVEAIMATVPAWDGAKMRLIQPNLKPDVKLTTVLMALADLGGGVMDGAAFADEGRLVYVEDHVYALDALLSANGNLPSNAAFLAEQMVKYLGSQIGFLKGVADRVEEEMLSLVVEVARDPIRSVCIGTEAAHKAAVKVYEKAKQMAGCAEYAQLFKFMGYNI